MKSINVFSLVNSAKTRCWQTLAIGVAALLLWSSHAGAVGLVQVELIVEAESIPEGAVVYVTGSQPELGNWNPEEIALTHGDDGNWRITVTSPMGSTLKYKFTLGSWATEALDRKRWVPTNHVLKVDGATSVVTRISAWLNDGHPPKGGITGLAKHHRQVKGEGLADRDIVVWLPPGYEEEQARRYPVIYGHDGQNLFDPSTSFIGVDWGLDETAGKLIEKGKLEPVIIVGIYNTIDRDEEYTNSEKGQAYMNFVIDTVKPLIDGAYRTLTDRDHTATMGSSAGGLVSFLLTWKHPEVFSQAACLSPAFLLGGPEHAVYFVTEGDRPTDGVRFYIDNGGQDLEQRLQPGCDLMLEALRAKGFVEDKDFVWFHDPEAGHNEPAWAKRAWQPLTFLFGTGNP